MTKSGLTLGDLIVQMGFISRRQLEEATEDLTQSTEEERYGRLLVGLNLITEPQLREVLSLMRELDAEDKGKRASAVQRLADSNTTHVINFATRVRKKAAAASIRAQENRRETGDRFPAITPSMLGSEEG